MQILNNAIVFKASLPSAEALADHMLELPFHEVQSNHKSSYGFVVSEITGEMVTPMAGVDGFSINVRIDDKVIPPSVVNKKVKDRIKDIEAFGEVITSKRKGEVKTEVIYEMLPTAFAKTSIVTAYYERETGYLVIDTTRKSIASLVVSMLVKVCGSVTTETINVSDVKLGVTAKLRNLIDTEDFDSFDGFDVGEFCSLKKVETGEKKIYEGSSLTGDRAEDIVSDIDSGFVVENVQLSRNDVKFKLTSDFCFKQFKFGKAEIEADDEAYSWRNESTSRFVLVSSVITAMCNLVGYKDKEIV